MAAPPGDSIYRQDVSLIALNAGSPLVTRDLARKLGDAYLERSYPGAKVSADSPKMEEGAESWSLTYTIVKPPQSMQGVAGALSTHPTLTIRKRDGALLSIR